MTGNAHVKSLLQKVTPTRCLFSRLSTTICVPLLLFLLFFSACKQNVDEMIKLEQFAKDDLRKLLFNQNEWIKVHAAEFLLWQDIAVDDVYSVFLKEDSLHSSKSPYRIGIWRVLSQAATLPEDKAYWRDKIVATFVNENSVDRLHAIESLAKLGYPLYPRYPVIMDTMLSGSETDPMTLYAHWNNAFSDTSSFEKTHMYMLKILSAEKNTEQRIIQIASYIIRYLGKLGVDEWMVLRDVATGSHADVSTQANLLATAWLTMPDVLMDSELSEVKSNLVNLVDGDFATGIPHLLTAIGGKGDEEDWQILRRLYLDAANETQTNYDADLHATASFAMLSIIFRQRAE